MYKCLSVLFLILPVMQIEFTTLKEKTEEIEIEKIRQRYCKFVGYAGNICSDLKQNRTNHTKTIIPPIKTHLN